MKKVIYALILALLLFPHLSSAQINYPMSSTYINADTAVAIAAGKEIYGYTLLATTAVGEIGLYDVATLGSATTSNVISELTEATQYNSQSIWFPKPLVTANGCSIVINNASAVIYHQP